MAPNKASDECGNPAGPVAPSSPRYASIFWTVTTSSARQWSQHFLGSRWLPQSPPGGDEQLGDMMMEHLANIQGVMTAASVTHTAVSFGYRNGRRANEMIPHVRSSP